MQDFSTKLNELIQSASLTRAELARQIGIAPRNVSRWNTHGIPQYAIAFLEERAKNIALTEENTILRQKLQDSQVKPRKQRGE